MPSTESNFDIDEASLPKAHTPRHQAMLSLALRNGVRSRGAGLWESLRQMETMKKLGAGVAMAAVILTISFAFSAQDANNVAQAEETVNKAFMKSAKLTVEQREALSEKMEGDLMNSLAEAKQAADLTYLTPEEFNAEMAVGHGPKNIQASGGKHIFNLKFLKGPAPEGQEPIELKPIDKEALNARFSVAPLDFQPGEIHGMKIFEPAKYLRYTDTQGQVIYLGIDENDVPVMKIMKLSEEMIKGFEKNMKMVTPSDMGPESGFTWSEGVRIEEVEVQ